MATQIKHILPFIFVGLAATLWGGIGIFIDALDKFGFTSLQIVGLRVVSATFMLLLYILLQRPSLLNIALKDIRYFIGTGVLSIAFFNWCYFTAIKEISLSLAVILLYTGPAFVVILSRLFFGERITKSKLAALVLTFLGCILVVKLFPLQVDTLSLNGILIGLGAGFGYALYSIFGKKALAKYSPVTILFYTFLTASMAVLPLSVLHNPSTLTKVMESHVFLWVVGLGFFPTVLAYLLYTLGLSKIEAGKASITALIEPVAATLLGVSLFNEVLSFWQVIGIFLVLSSVLLIQLRQPLGRLFQFRH